MLKLFKDKDFKKICKKIKCYNLSSPNFVYNYEKLMEEFHTWNIYKYYPDYEYNIIIETERKCLNNNLKFFFKMLNITKFSLSLLSKHIKVMDELLYKSYNYNYTNSPKKFIKFCNNMDWDCGFYEWTFYVHYQSKTKYSYYNFRNEKIVKQIIKEIIEKIFNNYFNQ